MCVYACDCSMLTKSIIFPPPTWQSSSRNHPNPWKLFQALFLRCREFFLLFFFCFFSFAVTNICKVLCQGIRLNGRSKRTALAWLSLFKVPWWIVSLVILSVWGSNKPGDPVGAPERGSIWTNPGKWRAWFTTLLLQLLRCFCSVIGRPITADRGQNAHFLLSECSNAVVTDPF